MIQERKFLQWANAIAMVLFNERNVVDGYAIFWENLVIEIILILGMFGSIVKIVKYIDI